MDYFKFEIRTDTLNNEVLIALLSTQPFDTFVEIESGFDAYLPTSLDSPDLYPFLSELQERFNFTFKRKFIKGENWNVEWEKNFSPIQVGNFCGIRAEFHQPINEVSHELIITPKMAFGTGHHETTYMVIQLMEHLPLNKMEVLDYGCGTGVLAILASKLGARSIDAIDIEQASYQNTIENCVTNNVSNVNAFMSTIDLMDGNTYGIVLANINRNVILESLNSLTQKLVTNGVAIFSGFILDDEQLMIQELTKSGFKIQKTLRKNNWLAMQCVKT